MTSTKCILEVAWREVGEEPTSPEDIWPANQTIPSSGEIRWVFITNDEQFPPGEPVWMMWQPEMVYINGWANEVDLEALAPVQVVIHEQEKLPAKETYSTISYWAKVECLQVISLVDIVKRFPESLSSPGIRRYARPLIQQYGRFIEYSFSGQYDKDFFLILNSKPPRMILFSEGEGPFDQLPIRICNCVFDSSKRASLPLPSQPKWPSNRYPL